MTYTDFISQAHRRYLSTQGEESFGVFYLRCLQEARPDIAEKVKGTLMDPLHETFGSECLHTLFEFVLYSW